MPDPGIARRRRLVLEIAIAVVICAVLVAIACAAVWWFNGGAHLEGGTGGITGPVALGEPFNMSMFLDVDGGEVELVSAQAHDVSPELVVTTQMVLSGGPGGGAEVGDIETLGYEVAPIAGTRIDSDRPEGSGPQLLVTLVASEPGVFSLHDVDVTYKAGPRTRHARLTGDACLLVTMPGFEAETHEQLNRDDDDTRPMDPDVQQFRLDGCEAE